MTGNSHRLVGSTWLTLNLTVCTCTHLVPCGHTHDNNTMIGARAARRRRGVTEEHEGAVGAEWGVQVRSKKATKGGAAGVLAEILNQIVPKYSAGPVRTVLHHTGSLSSLWHMQWHTV